MKKYKYCHGRIFLDGIIRFDNSDYIIDKLSRKGNSSMGIVKGQFEYKRFKSGKKLTMKESILAMCYECNGLEESGTDCMVGEDGDGLAGCPLYRYHPHRKREKRKITESQRRNLEKGRKGKTKEVGS